MPSEPRKQEMLLRMLILEMLLVSKDENMARKDSTSHLHQIFKRRYYERLSWEKYSGLATQCMPETPGV